MKRQAIQQTLKCLTIAGLVSSVGVLASGCKTSSCSSCKAKSQMQKPSGGSSCGAKKSSSCSAAK